MSPIILHRCLVVVIPTALPASSVVVFSSILHVQMQSKRQKDDVYPHKQVPGQKLADAW